MCQRKTAFIGLAVVAVSLFVAVEPAAAAAPSRTTLSSSTPSIGVGSTAKLKAVVKQVTGTSQPTGAVTFREGTTATSPAVAPPVTLVTVNTVMTAKLDLTTLAIGNHTFIATYSGSTAFNASTSLTINILVKAVAKADTTTVASMSTPSSVAPLADVKLKAVVKQVSGFTKPTGSVTFSDNGVAISPTAPLVLIGTVETAKLTVTTLSVGSHTITATYSGTGAFNPSTSTEVITVSVGKIATTTVALPVHVNPDTGRIVMPAEVTAADGSTPTGFITFEVPGQGGIQTLLLGPTGKAQISKALTSGSGYTVIVTFLGDSAYNGSTATLSFTAP